MNSKRNYKIQSLVLSLMLVFAMAFATTGCTTNEQSSTTQPTTEAQTTASTEENTGATVLGEGQTKFSFKVVDKDSKETSFEINTDKKTVGEALLELGLISGDEGEYGLYVKTVNGITADYDVDKSYWAFYVDGEYATTGVDSTNAEAGKTYTFKVEK